MKVSDFLDPVLAVPIALIFLLAGPGLWFAIRAQRKSDKIIVDQWADENGFKIVSAKRRYFAMGPLTWKYVYGLGFKIMIITRTGETRTEWLAFVWGQGGSRIRRGPCKADVAWETENGVHNQSPEPVLSSGTSRAVHEPRHP